MTTSEVNFLPKSTVEITITIPWADIKDTYEKVFTQVVEATELPGFRKGKAPKKLVEEKIDKTKIYEEVIKQVVPKAYAEALKTHNLSPIVSPRIEILEAKDNADWKIKATLAQKPEVKLKNYRKAISDARSTKKLWVPGQKEEDKDKDKFSLEDVFSILLKEVEVEVPDILVEEELNRMLARLIDETKKLGMTVEQYLVVKGKTTEQIRAEYRQQAENTLKLEFMLEAIADDINISVSEAEIDAAIAKVPEEEDRKKLKADSYYLASLLRRQKTLDSLMKPIV